MAKLNAAEVKFYLQEAQSCENRQLKELIQRNNYPLLLSYYEGFEQKDVNFPHVSSKHKLDSHSKLSSQNSPSSRTSRI